MKRARLWFAFPDPEDGGEWRVYLTRRKICAGLRGNKADGPAWGITYFDGRRIYIDIEQPRKEVQDTLLHELQHVAMREVNIPGQWEEQLIHHITPRLLAIMIGVGFRWPAIPEALTPMLKSDNLTPQSR